LLDLKRAPEFEAWLEAMQITDAFGQIRYHSRNPLRLDWIES
jgi:ethanolamine ammonia-lyase large subunit